MSLLDSPNSVPAHVDASMLLLMLTSDSVRQSILSALSSIATTAPSMYGLKYTDNAPAFNAFGRYAPKVGDTTELLSP